MKKNQSFCFLRLKFRQTQYAQKNKSCFYDIIILWNIKCMGNIVPNIEPFVSKHIFKEVNIIFGENF